MSDLHPVLGQNLSPAARKRHTVLQRAASEAEALMRSAVTERRELDAELQQRESGEILFGDDAGAVVQLRKDIADAEANVEARDAARRHALAVVNTIEYWLAANIDARLELVSIPAPKLKAGENAVQALDRARGLVDRLTAELGTVERAPALAAELKPQVAAIVANLVELGRPKLNTADGTLAVAWRPASTLNSTPHAMPLWHVQFAAWIDPDAMAARLTAEIDAMPQDGALSAADKAARTVDLNARLFDAGLLEEGCIQALLRDGTTVKRRISADPRCVLGVQIRRVAEAA